ncbi:hypothetical protein RHCRD62_70092 [Rhodococcus sp. RD6.2]|nr:hypothetical protein RHCRD62_70092 [Rhodococcus sp. RD6.2]
MGVLPPVVFNAVKCGSSNLIRLQD